MATNSDNHGHNATKVGYFTFEIAWEVANKGTKSIFCWQFIYTIVNSTLIITEACNRCNCM